MRAKAGSSNLLVPLILDMGVIVAAGALLGLTFNPQALREPAAKARLERPIVAATISVDEVVRHYEEGSLVVVDSRAKEAFIKGHIPGALALRHDGYESRLRHIRRYLPKNAPCLLVIGEGDNDINALQLASTLRMSGHDGARTLAGGMEAWRRRGLPVVQGWDMDEVLEGRSR